MDPLVRGPALVLFAEEIFSKDVARGDVSILLGSLFGYFSHETYKVPFAQVAVLLHKGGYAKEALELALSVCVSRECRYLYATTARSRSGYGFGYHYCVDLGASESLESAALAAESDLVETA